MSISNIPKVSPGNPIRADMFNAMVDGILASAPAPGGNTLLSSGSGGVAITAPRHETGWGRNPFIVPRHTLGLPDPPLQFIISEVNTEGDNYDFHVGGGFVNWGVEDIEVAGYVFSVELKKETEKLVIWEAKKVGTYGEIREVDADEELEPVIARILLGRITAREIKTGNVDYNITQIIP